MMQGMTTETKMGNIMEAEEMKPKQGSEHEKEEDIHKNKDKMMKPMALIWPKVENLTSDDLTKIRKEGKTDEINLKEHKTESEVKKRKELNVDVVNPNELFGNKKVTTVDNEVDGVCDEEVKSNGGEMSICKMNMEQKSEASTVGKMKSLTKRTKKANQKNKPKKVDVLN